MRLLDLAFVQTLLLFPAGSNLHAQLVPAERLINPGIGIGLVTAEISEARLLALVGAERADRIDLYISNGYCAAGSRINAATPDELEITWTDRSDSLPALVPASGSGIGWQTRAGIHVGSDVMDLEAVSGEPVRFSGFGGDYGGRATWSEADGRLGLRLRPSAATEVRTASDPRYSGIFGQHQVSSADSLVSTMTILVDRIWVSFRRIDFLYPCPAR